MIRLATLHDIPRLTDMVVRFVSEEMPDPPKPDPEVVQETILLLIKQQDNHGMAVVYEVEGEIWGMILATTVPSAFSKQVHAIELAYYVLPEHRKSKAWRELLDTYERWAKYIAKADIAAVALLDQRVGKLYERRGYKLTEMSYKKEL